jgi:TolB protein
MKVLTTMKVVSAPVAFGRWAAVLACWVIGAMGAGALVTAHAADGQTSTMRRVPTPIARMEPPLRSSIFVYDLRDGSSHLVYAADAIWEAPNWSPDGKYLISNSKGGIYKLALKADGTAEEPQKLAIPDEYRCNNDKGLSPDGKMLAFSASIAPKWGSQVFLSNADGTDVKQMTAASPSYFHGWSPDSKRLAFVAQRNGSGQYDIYSMLAAGGAEQRLTMNVHQDDGPDYSPDGKWIYINSDRSGKEAVWRFPADGAGPDDAKAQMVVSDGLEDWFPHIAPDGKKMVYIGYPAGTPTHDPRHVAVEIKLVAINVAHGHDKVAASQKTLVKAVGGQGTMNVNSWAPDSERFAYVTYEAIP